MRFMDKKVGEMPGSLNQCFSNFNVIQIDRGYCDNADSDSESLGWRPEMLHSQQAPR